MEYLGNNKFASCSMDSTFIIWNLNNLNNDELIINDVTEIENFYLNYKNLSFESLVTLNKKGALSLYVNHNGKPFLKNVILNIDFTNSNSMIKIKNDLYIGGYEYFHVISIKYMHIKTKIKMEKPVSFIYNSNKSFIILGLKNGELEF